MKNYPIAYVAYNTIFTPVVKGKYTVCAKNGLEAINFIEKQVRQNNPDVRVVMIVNLNQIKQIDNEKANDCYTLS